MNGFARNARRIRAAALGVLLAALASGAVAAVLQVAPGQSIAAAVRAAQAGDTVRVARGVYN